MPDTFRASLLKRNIPIFAIEQIERLSQNIAAKIVKNQLGSGGAAGRTSGIAVGAQNGLPFRTRDSSGSGIGIPDIDGKTQPFSVRGRTGGLGTAPTTPLGSPDGGGSIAGGNVGVQVPGNNVPNLGATPGLPSGGRLGGGGGLQIPGLGGITNGNKTPGVPTKGGGNPAADGEGDQNPNMSTPDQNQSIGPAPDPDATPVSSTPETPAPNDNSATPASREEPGLKSDGIGDAIIAIGAGVLVGGSAAVDIVAGVVAEGIIHYFHKLGGIPTDDQGGSGNPKGTPTEEQSGPVNPKGMPTEDQVSPAGPKSVPAGAFR